jgi:hypothetical protein
MADHRAGPGALCFCESFHFQKAALYILALPRRRLPADFIRRQPMPSSFNGNTEA